MPGDEEYIKRQEELWDEKQRWDAEARKVINATVFSEYARRMMYSVKDMLDNGLDVVGLDSQSSLAQKLGIDLSEGERLKEEFAKTIESVGFIKWYLKVLRKLEEHYHEKATELEKQRLREAQEHSENRFK